MVFVEHDEDEGEPGAEEGECRGGDFAAEDAVFDAQDGGAGYAEEEFVLGDRFSRNLMCVSMSLWNLRWRVVAVRSWSGSTHRWSSYLPTPRPASWFLRSCSLTFGLISAPEAFSQARKVWLAPSKSAI